MIEQVLSVGRMVLEFGGMFLEYLNSGYGTTLILILSCLVIGWFGWRLHTTCQKRYADCEYRSKHLTYALWHFVSGDHDKAKELTDKIMSEHYGGEP